MLGCGMWDECLLKNNFLETNVEAILKIPLVSNNDDDRLLCGGLRMGFFRSKVPTSWLRKIKDCRLVMIWI